MGKIYFCSSIPAQFKSSLWLSVLNVKVKWGNEEHFFPLGVNEKV